MALIIITTQRVRKYGECKSNSVNGAQCPEISAQQCSGYTNEERLHCNRYRWEGNFYISSDCCQGNEHGRVSHSPERSFSAAMERKPHIIVMSPENKRCSEPLTGFDNADGNLTSVGNKYFSFFHKSFHLKISRRNFSPPLALPHVNFNQAGGHCS